MHSRDQITTAFIVALSAVAGTTTTRGQIFSVYDDQLPLQTVYANDEDIETDNTSGRIIGIQRRTATVTVQGYVKALDGLDKAMDEMSVAIEETLFNDAPLKNLVRCLDLVSTAKETSKEGEQEIGIITLTYSCKYLTEDGKPQIIL